MKVYVLTSTDKWNECSHIVGGFLDEKTAEKYQDALIALTKRFGSVGYADISNASFDRIERLFQQYDSHFTMTDRNNRYWIDEVTILDK